MEKRSPISISLKMGLANYLIHLMDYFFNVEIKINNKNRINNLIKANKFYNYHLNLIIILNQIIIVMQN